VAVGLFQSAALAFQSEDPGPEDPALVHFRGVMKVADIASRIQVSGVGCSAEGGPPVKQTPG